MTFCELPLGPVPARVKAPFLPRTQLFLRPDGRLYAYPTYSLHTTKIHAPASARVSSCCASVSPYRDPRPHPNPNDRTTCHSAAPRKPIWDAKKSKARRAGRRQAGTSQRGRNSLANSSPGQKPRKPTAAQEGDGSPARQHKTHGGDSSHGGEGHQDGSEQETRGALTPFFARRMVTFAERPQSPGPCLLSVCFWKPGEDTHLH